MLYRVEMSILDGFQQNMCMLICKNWIIMLMYNEKKKVNLTDRTRFVRNLQNNNHKLSCVPRPVEHHREHDFMLVLN